MTPKSVGLVNMGTRWWLHARMKLSMMNDVQAVRSFTSCQSPHVSLCGQYPFIIKYMLLMKLPAMKVWNSKLPSMCLNYLCNRARLSSQRLSWQSKAGTFGRNWFKFPRQWEDKVVHLRSHWWLRLQGLYSKRHLTLFSELHIQPVS